jgi:DNA polymerase III epsilon subunit-like protein
MKVLIFDTETTGLPKTKIMNQDTLDKWPHIVQFSFVIFDTSENDITKTYDSIIKMQDGLLIPAESTAIHGITSEISEKCGINVEEALKEFFLHLKEVDLLVGHNVVFDINMVYIELLRVIYSKKYDQRVISDYKFDLHFLTNFNKIYCTMQESIELCEIHAVSKYGKEYTKFPKLSELHEKLFATKPQNLHNSLVDILITLRCFMKLNSDRDILLDCEKYAKIVEKMEIV